MCGTGLRSRSTPTAASSAPGFKDYVNASVSRDAEKAKEQMAETGSVTPWHGCYLGSKYGPGLDETTEPPPTPTSSTPSLSEKDSVRLFSLYFPNALQGRHYRNVQ